MKCYLVTQTKKLLFISVDQKTFSSQTKCVSLTRMWGKNLDKKKILPKASSRNLLELQFFIGGNYFWFPLFRIDPRGDGATSFVR